MITKILKGFVYAANGILYAFKTQLNFRIEALTGVVAIVLSVVLHIDRNEFLWIIVAITMVLIAELLNTAIEILVDLVSPQYNEKAGRIKDVSAGLVLIAALASLVIGSFIFLPKLLAHAT